MAGALPSPRGPPPGPGPEVPAGATPGGASWLPRAGPEALLSPRRRISRTSELDINSFCTDPQLLNPKTSPAQRALLRAIYGLLLTSEELDIFKACAGRALYPGHAFPEVTVVVPAPGKTAALRHPSSASKPCSGAMIAD
jgi:hypothetical protein